MLTIGPGLTPPPAPNWSQAQLAQTRRELALNGNNLAVQYRTSEGPGGTAFWMRTPQSEIAQARDFSAHGYDAVRLAPTQFQSSYLGGLLRSDFGGLRVDFKA
ncbi:MAG: hypothetical protein KGJ86_05980 [Chloroflexota bacterium]|nr:hypothetical protein [Chloroflexota bacterium]